MSCLLFVACPLAFSLSGIAAEDTLFHSFSLTSRRPLTQQVVEESPLHRSRCSKRKMSQRARPEGERLRRETEGATAGERATRSLPVLSTSLIPSLPASSLLPLSLSPRDPLRLRDSLSGVGVLARVCLSAVARLQNGMQERQRQWPPSTSSPSLIHSLTRSVVVPLAARRLLPTPTLLLQPSSRSLSSFFFATLGPCISRIFVPLLGLVCEVTEKRERGKKGKNKRGKVLWSAEQKPASF